MITELVIFVFNDIVSTELIKDCSVLKQSNVEFQPPATLF